MKLAVYSGKAYEKPFLDAANADARHELLYLDAALISTTVCGQSKPHDQNRKCCCGRLFMT